MKRLCAVVPNSGFWNHAAALHYFRGSWVLIYWCFMLIEHFCRFYLIKPTLFLYCSCFYTFSALGAYIIWKDLITDPVKKTPFLVLIV